MVRIGSIYPAREAPSPAGDLPPLHQPPALVIRRAGPGDWPSGALHHWPQSGPSPWTLPLDSPPGPSPWTLPWHLLLDPPHRPRTPHHQYDPPRPPSCPRLLLISTAGSFPLSIVDTRQSFPAPEIPPSPSHQLWMIPVPQSDLPVPQSDLPVPQSDLPVPPSDLPVPQSDLPVPQSDLPIKCCKLDRPY